MIINVLLMIASGSAFVLAHFGGFSAWAAVFGATFVVAAGALVAGIVGRLRRRHTAR